ncbi:Hypothetical_protein [Hexamita inflata]|uniref:Hypothetical_protein n=1 Tax=Hexamita inflata TaxID=28002 RepID=A0ABP1K324_9EUKA
MQDVKYQRFVHKSSKQIKSMQFIDITLSCGDSVTLYWSYYWYLCNVDLEISNNSDVFRKVILLSSMYCKACDIFQISTNLYSRLLLGATLIKRLQMEEECILLATLGQGSGRIWNLYLEKSVRIINKLKRLSIRFLKYIHGTNELQSILLYYQGFIMKY